MTVFSIKNKIFPIIGLLLAVTISSFSGMKGAPLNEGPSISAQSSNTNQQRKQSSEAETPQNNGEESDDKYDKIEDAVDPFVIEHFIANYINHQVNHIYEFQIALYREQHRVIFSPPPEA